MNKSRMKIIIPAALVIGGVIILQYHAIQFWATRTGAGIGWAWSLMIELAGLWLWYQPETSSRALGAVASIILLAAPLYHLGAGAWHQVETVTEIKGALSQQEILLRESIAGHKKTIEDFTRNSRSRAGWAKEIERVQVRLDADKRALNILIEQKKERATRQKGDIMQSVTDLIITSFLQCSALIIIQLSNIKAIIFMARTHKEQEAAQKRAKLATLKHTHLAVTPGNHTHEGLMILKQKCKERMEQLRVNITEFAEMHGLKRQQVSVLVNYKEGARKPSLTTLEVLERGLA